MSTVCSAVIIIVLVTMFMFARSRNSEYAFAMWPLVLVPAAHIIGGLLSSAFRAQLSARGWLMVGIILDLAALLTFLLLLFFRTGANISGRHSRRVFLMLSIGFMCVFTGILVSDLARQIAELMLETQETATAALSMSIYAYITSV